jgi:hypothetical protein
VVDTANRPIKFDGLIGNAVRRESATAQSAYSAIPIQAASVTATGALIQLGKSSELVFDGKPGHYQPVTGVIIGDVVYDKTTSPYRTTFLTLLTLDVRANRPNLPTFVDLNFFNSNGPGVSVSTEFICWEEVSLSGFNNGVGPIPQNSPPGAISINEILTDINMGTRKGIVISDPAQKVATGGIVDTAGPVTLLGLVTVVEGLTGTERENFYQLLNDSNPVPTSFFPN